MKTKLMYVADDGTSFDTEKECIDYEKSTNKYVVLYKDKETNLIKREFADESSAKRFIANSLHDCYEDSIVGDFKLVHHGKTVEFNSTELGEVVPAHYKINGEKLNEVFQLAVARDVKIPGYTLHGDYYLSDNVIIGVDWEEACGMRQTVVLPNGKKVIAHTLSKEELETIPKEERAMKDWYWTSTPYDVDHAWSVSNHGDFLNLYINFNSIYGGVRLGFKNPFAN